MVHSNRNPRANLGRKRLKGEGTQFPLSGTSGGARRNAPSDLIQEAGAGKPNRGGEPTSSRRRQLPPSPTNPHDPTSKDPFMRAGMGMGRNKSKIMKRAGMSMM